MFWSRNFDLKLWYTFEKLNIGIYILIERDKTFMFQGGDSPLLVPLGLKKTIFIDSFHTGKLRAQFHWNVKNEISWSLRQ